MTEKENENNQIGFIKPHPINIGKCIYIKTN